jgi:uncharacterized repeat protein (TIGR03833 family)
MGVDNQGTTESRRKFENLHKLRYEIYRMSSIERVDIKPGQRVLVVLKSDQRSGKLTEGVVKNILTRSTAHRHGIKVRLESGLVGRVKEIKHLPTC